MNTRHAKLALTLCLGLATLTLGGCVFGHHRNKAASCKEPVIGAEARNLPPLKVPPGLDAPDTRNSIRIPELTEPERARGPGDPCLSRPPKYVPAQPVRP